MKSWIKKGSRPDEYEIGTDDSITYNGKRSAFIKSIAEQTTGFGTLMQSFSAESYRGKRMRFMAAVKTENVTDWVGLWMRVDGLKYNESLAFDNMDKRRITGSTDWQTYEVVLDVPAEARKIAIGILLERSGHAWISDVRFEEVDDKVLVTASGKSTWYADKPGNLDFSE